jgi:histidine triad (HIT) family protein
VSYSFIFTTMSSIFTKIINREIPGHFIYEDEFCVAIMDKFPAVKGQSLVIPKKDIDYAFDLDDDSYIHLFKIAKKIAKASDRALGAARTCLVVEGFDVPHVHVKIYPMQDTEKALGAIMHEGAEASDEELSLVATQITAALEDDADSE